MLYAEKILRRKIARGGKTYYVSLIQIEDPIDKYFQFLLCLKAVGSGKYVTVYLKGDREEREEIIRLYFPGSRGVGKKFPEINGSQWRKSKYHLATVANGRVGFRIPLGKNHHGLLGDLGRRVGQFPWRALLRIKNGESLVGK